MNKNYTKRAFTMGTEDRYWWIDTMSSDGMIYLYSGLYDEDGQKLRDSEEAVMAFEPPFGADHDWSDEEVAEADAYIDSVIEKELGFIPDYEIN